MEVRLLLLMAKAQRVGRLQQGAIDKVKEYGPRAQIVKKAWAAYYAALEEQNSARAVFVTDMKEVTNV